MTLLNYMHLMEEGGKKVQRGRKKNTERVNEIHGVLKERKIKTGEGKIQRERVRKRKVWRERE